MKGAQPYNPNPKILRWWRPVCGIEGAQRLLAGCDPKALLPQEPAQPGHSSTPIPLWDLPWDYLGTT